MKKNKDSKTPEIITDMDVAKVLGMEEDYNKGLLKGDMKEYFEELLRKEKSKDHDEQI